MNTLSAIPVSYTHLRAHETVLDLVRSRGLGDVYKRQACWVLLSVLAWDIVCSMSQAIGSPTL